jgi:hypothetical protein
MKRIITKLLDDLDGGDADESVTFGLDGVDHEIDLSDTHAKQLREAFAPYVAAGTKIGRTAWNDPRHRPTTDREQNRAIREWALKAGKNIADRGRIPQEIVDEFRRRAA